MDLLIVNNVDKIRNELQDQSNQLVDLPMVPYNTKSFHVKLMVTGTG